ncbi:MAG: DUF2177 family protein [Hyphomonadaceae bacterium]
MASYGAAWIAVGVTFLALDAIWLSQMAPRIYQPVIGAIMAERVNFLAAALFYLLYVSGVVLFAVSPALRHGVLHAAMLGALLGLLAYGTYDLSNMATLRTWSWGLSAIDMAWGAAATAAAASMGHLAASWFTR